MRAYGAASMVHAAECLGEASSATVIGAITAAAIISRRVIDRMRSNVGVPLGVPLVVGKLRNYLHLLHIGDPVGQLVEQRTFDP